MVVTTEAADTSASKAKKRRRVMAHRERWCGRALDRHRSLEVELEERDLIGG
jgi:hypothetical protein